MSWMIIGLLIMMLLILTSKGIPSGKRKEFFLRESQELKEMKDFANETLKDSNEIITMKAVRKKYSLSLVDSKKVIDLVKGN